MNTENVKKDKAKSIFQLFFFSKKHRTAGKDLFIVLEA
jgi:hypothetical protein